MWLVSLNAVIMFFLKNEVMRYFKKNVDMYLEFYNRGLIKKLPPYIKVVKKRNKITGYQFYGSLKNGYVYIKLERIKKRLRFFSLMLFLWEFLLTVFIVFIFYVALKRIFDRQRNAEEFLRFVLIAMSHKLGNFLSSQKLNLELSEIDPESKERLKLAMDEVERDFKTIYSTLKSMKLEGEKLEKVDVVSELKNIVDSFGVLSRFKVNVEGKIPSLTLNSDDFRLVLHELVNNALKYSEGVIEIEVAPYNRNSVKVAVRNKIKHISRGSGIGVKVVEFLCRRNGWIFTRKAIQDMFEAILIFSVPKKGVFFK